MFDEFALLAAHRHADLNLASDAQCQRFGKQGAVLDVVAEQNERWRRPFGVELRDERPQNAARCQAAIGAREIGAVAPVLEGAEEEHFDAELAAFLRDREDIGLFDKAWIYPLLPLNRR